MKNEEVASIIPIIKILTKKNIWKLKIAVFINILII